MNKKLTKPTVDNAEPGPAEYIIWDTEVPGFGVRVQTSGRKVYMIRYRTQDGTQRKMKLGRTCDMHPDKAREMARKAFQEVAEGKDPASDRQEAKTAPTMTELEAKYTAEHAKPFKKASSQRSDEMNWRLHILPAMGNKKVRAVTHGDVLKLFGSLADKRATANQVLALLSKAFNLAETWGMRPRNSNPCADVKKFDIAEKECILSAAQISQLNTTLDTMTGDGRIRAEFAAFIRLLMLTGCRKSEVMLAKSEWIDLERGLLLLPDSKVGQRRITLAPAALEIAKSLVSNGGEWLIPGRRSGHPLQTPYKVWKAVKVAAGLPIELRLHDLRHTAGSLAHMAGATQKEIAEMLGHSQLSTTERYLHSAEGSAGRTAAALGNVITSAWTRSTAPV